MHTISPVPTPGVIVSDESGEESPLLTPIVPESLKHPEPEQSLTSRTVQYAFALAFVIGTGVVAGYISEHYRNEDGGPEKEVLLEWKSQALGWASAVLYCELPYF